MKEKVLELRSQGYSFRQIQKEVGFSLGKVSYICNPDQKEKNNERNKLHYKPHPVQKILHSPDQIKLWAKTRMLKHRYNITYEEYLQLYENQNGKCGICFNSFELGGFKGLYVDHDHKTEKIRGLLCPTCNSALGKFKDSEIILQNAITYLTKS